ncbi:hypothetical protein DLE54_00105 [Psychrobacter sp. YP14]|uniref:DUF2986 domain-containing protein n=1 Tax=Psychrobacter sanguinis TaxID=861445 RepID=A0A844LZ24_9GAMM|nr:hypothetical protein DLE54_00105 [Psychrobacter sp. YP14]MUG31793.1 DUF2986 domain-containing protein [Psychrobacter sanguinis]
MQSLHKRIKQQSNKNTIVNKTHYLTKAQT